MPIAVR